MAVAAAILVGGGANRMGGKPKSFLTVKGQRIIDRQLEVLRPLFEEIFVVGRDPSPYAGLGLGFVSDIVNGGQGPLVGVLTAVTFATADEVLCVGCDMPFLSRRALELIRDRKTDCEIVVPRVAGRAEPLFARYSRKVEPLLRRQLETGDHSMQSVLAVAKTCFIEEPELRSIDPDLQFLRNVNTPLDLADANHG